ncbi:hypothetical protein [Robiginitalea aurantiaca]|uniref:DUF4870 domain-containing protein n=1 Tax=Robiginitalea aurantiaca TaxID=3056915 RepID=A0ABT7WG00_9FLAO|nr:hypothetical protein [Robiginitalea aurantiaca]MDM9631846.1 hypothetical protein [Robiginitalea aurantiaca]
MQQPDSNGKTIAIISYLTMVGALIAITMNAEPKYDFARFHIRQAFGLHLGFLAFALFLSQWWHPYAWFGLYLCYFILWIYGFLGAVQGYKRLVPLVGSLFQRWFLFIN